MSDSDPSSGFGPTAPESGPGPDPGDHVLDLDQVLVLNQDPVHERVLVLVQDLVQDWVLILG